MIMTCVFCVANFEAAYIKYTTTINLNNKGTVYITLTKFNNILTRIIERLI